MSIRSLLIRNYHLDGKKCGRSNIRSSYDCQIGKGDDISIEDLGDFPLSDDDDISLESLSGSILPSVKAKTSTTMDKVMAKEVKGMVSASQYKKIKKIYSDFYDSKDVDVEETHDKLDKVLGGDFELFEKVSMALGWA